MKPFNCKLFVLKIVTWSYYCLLKIIIDDDNYTRMLQVIFNKSCRQQSTKQQLYSHFPPIMKTIQVRQTRHARQCWRSWDKLIRDILLWTPSHGRAKAGEPAKTYIQQLGADTGCSLEDLQEAMDNIEGWQERVREICTGGATWWWWWLLISHNHMQKGV